MRHFIEEHSTQIFIWMVLAAILFTGIYLLVKLYFFLDDMVIARFIEITISGM